MNRRRFLGELAATVAAAGFAGIGTAKLMLDSSPGKLAQAQGVAPAATTAPIVAVPAPARYAPHAEPLLPPPPAAARVALPVGGMLNRLPGQGDLLALTLDDGVNTDVVRLYTEFARDTGVRLTYFINGTYKSWTDNLTLLRPLVESGQVQLANHTWSHPDLTTVSKSRIADEISRNDQFLTKTYGVDAKPYFRPPYGRHNQTVDAVAADLGYTATTTWCGSLADSTVVTEDYIVKMAKQYFTAQSIVLGHLNHPPVTHVYPQLVDVIRDRNLRTVTLNDIFQKAAGR
ncbi:MAG: polysaccharide deacetylase family protein [Mycobacteriaceae bacterium]|nr:polysaccharide deacetylase family protein [Mycobacteriaceae bacterium]